MKDIMVEKLMKGPYFDYTRRVVEVFFFIKSDSCPSIRHEDESSLFDVKSLSSSIKENISIKNGDETRSGYSAT
jgi:hypothetical protein